VETAIREWIQKQEPEFNRELFFKRPLRWEKGIHVFEDYTGKS
jgi:hypothetical protein